MPGERDEFDIARVAALARLRLSPAEADLYQAQLTQILAFVGQVREAAGDPVSAAAPGCQHPAERADAAVASLAAGAVIGNAPDAIESPALIRVPKVIG